MGTSRYVSICIRFLVVLHHSIKLIRLGGENDDGFMLYLKKMNLELFKTKQAQATDSWSVSYTHLTLPTNTRV